MNALPRGKLRRDALLKEAEHKVVDTIVALNSMGDRTPIFFVYPVTGDGGATYVWLSESLGDEQPFYAFQVPTKQRTPHYVTSVTEIAACLIDEFENIYPTGSFILGGYSAGAVLALEMAQQLTTLGRSPDLLIAVDKAPARTGVRTHPYSLPHRVLNLIRAEWRISSKSLAQHVIQKSVIFVKRKAAEKVQKKPSSPESLNLRGVLVKKGHTSEESEFIGKLFDLIESYKPQKFRGDLMIFLSTENLHKRVAIKWMKIVSPKPMILTIAGTHESIVVGDDVRVLAADMKWCIANQKNGHVALRQD
jgi:thioesterase domain-containing protein